LLQANSLKSSFSADQRTVASNMAYQMVDMMRANRRLAFEYTYINGETNQSETTCNRWPSTGAGNIVNDDSFGWLCQMVRELPIQGVAGAGPQVQLVNGVATVGITWNDRGPTGAATLTTFTVVTKL
jgi:type IV pilus assembly protein PilV